MAVAAESVAFAIELEVLALGHDYGSRRGLAPLSFTLTAPGLAAVTGPNGSGKSTLLRILAGLLRPSRGESRLVREGKVIPPAARRHEVGYVTPELAFYDELTVGENLEFAAEARGLGNPTSSVREALASLSLTSRAEDRVASLSSGMKQRLRLAFALLHRPGVLLLDEPGSHLDEDGRAIVDRLVEQHRRVGLVLIATNDEREWRLAGNRIELRGGGLGHPA